MLRIGSGMFRGRKIKAPEGIRPTSDRVREALFDSIGDKVVGSSFLDLCAGSGAVGFEALSRGAAHIMLVEKELVCMRSIKQHGAILSQGEQEGLTPGSVQYMHADLISAVRRFGGRRERFDLIFLDPPYSDPSIKNYLKDIHKYDILGELGLLILESSRMADLPESIGDSLTIYKQKKYGKALLTFYCYDKQGEDIIGL